MERKRIIVFLIGIMIFIGGATNIFADNISVESITVDGASGVSTITTDGGSLQMEANVLPATATDSSVTWSVINGTGSGTITSSGLLTAVSNGTVKVRATANDGSGVFGEKEISISGQVVPVKSVTAEVDGALTERNLEGKKIILNLTNETYLGENIEIDRNKIQLVNFPKGLTIGKATKTSDTQVEVVLGFDGTDFDEDISNFNIIIPGEILFSGKPLKTNNLLISGIKESSSSDDDDDDSSSGSDSKKSDNEKKEDKIIADVDGDKKEGLAEAKTETKNGKQTTTISVDEKKLDEKLEQVKKGAKLTLDIQENQGAVVGELNGQMVKNMEVMDAVLDMKTAKAEYILPAKEIQIDKVSEKLGKKVDLEDIRIQMEIDETSFEMLKIIEARADKDNFNLVVPPVDFTVTCTNSGKTVEVKDFNDYVERMIALPQGIDPEKITTGLIMYPDGTTCHVPTQITKVDGRYFAKINSLTNSTYSVIWNPKDYRDVRGHWAEEVCNEMGARKVVAETRENTFSPDQDVTRVVFAQTLVRALGLGEKGQESRFTDIDRSNSYFGAVATALEYDLVSGYEDNTFRASNNVTREEASALIVRAMKIAGLKVDYTKTELDSQLNQFKDKEEIAEWAREVVAICVKEGMIVGNQNSEFMPKDNMTKAQLAAIMMRMLESAELI